MGIFDMRLLVYYLWLTIAMEGIKYTEYNTGVSTRSDAIRSNLGEYLSESRPIYSK